MLEPKKKYRKALRTADSILAKENAIKNRLVLQSGIKLARLQAGVMQTTLADMAEISKHHLSAIENGKVPASFRLLVLIYSKLGLTLEIIAKIKL